MVSTDLLGLRQQDDVSYTPSIPTDFSGYLLDFSADEDLGIAEEGVHEMTAMSWKLGEGSTERSFTKVYIVEVPLSW